MSASAVGTRAASRAGPMDAATAAAMPSTRNDAHSRAAHDELGRRAAKITGAEIGAERREPEPRDAVAEREPERGPDRTEQGAAAECNEQTARDA